MYCKKCGAEIPDDSKFCRNCGVSVQKTDELDVKANSKIEKSNTSSDKNSSGPQREKQHKEIQKKPSKKKQIILCVVIVAAVLIAAFTGPQIYKSMIKTYDEDFIEALANGLRRRWGMTYGKLEWDTDDFNSFVDAELEQIQPFYDKKFKDDELKEMAVDYIDNLNKTKDYTYLIDSDFEKWNCKFMVNEYNERIVLLNAINEKYPLYFFDSDNREDFDDLIRNADEREKILSLVSGKSASGNPVENQAAFLEDLKQGLESHWTPNDEGRVLDGFLVIDTLQLSEYNELQNLLYDEMRHIGKYLNSEFRNETMQELATRYFYYLMEMYLSKRGDDITYYYNYNNRSDALYDINLLEPLAFNDESDDSMLQTLFHEQQINDQIYDFVNSSAFSEVLRMESGREWGKVVGSAKFEVNATNTSGYDFSAFGLTIVQESTEASVDKTDYIDDWKRGEDVTFDYTMDPVSDRARIEMVEYIIASTGDRGVIVF